jgi:hypothetical protein
MEESIFCLRLAPCHFQNNDFFHFTPSLYSSTKLYTKPNVRKNKSYTIVFKNFSVFSLGTMVVKPKQKKKKGNTKPLSAPIVKELTNLFQNKSQDFFILPNSEQIPPILNCITYQQEFLQSWSEKFYTPFSDRFSDEFRQTLCDSVKENIRIKFILRKFLHFWRSKHLKQVNTEDIVTLEIPSEPIQIVDWKTRQKYIYEKSTLLQDIFTKLQYHTGFFDQSIHPKNPLTNLPLTQSQMISVWNQFDPIPQKYILVSLFQTYKFNLHYFKLDQKIFLRLNALYKTMNQDCFDSKERLIDFIDLAYELENVRCFLLKYKNLLNEKPDHLHLQRWRTLCIRYYEAEIRYENNYDKKRDIHNKIWDNTIPLIREQKEVFN